MRKQSCFFSILLAITVFMTSSCGILFSRTYNNDQELFEIEDKDKAELLGGNVERPSGRTEFKVVHSWNDENLLGQIDRGGKLAILIGAEWCIPCKEVVKWWKNRDMGPFKPYYLLARTYEEWEDIDKRSGGILDKVEGTTPILVIVNRSNPKKQRYRYQTVVKYGTDYNGCTDGDGGVADWLNKNKY